MKRYLLAALIVIGVASPSFAFIDAIVTTAKAVKDEAYQKFMMVKAVEQLKALRDNYAASMRYYELYKQWNQGHGILANVAHRIGDVGDETWKQAEGQFADDWIYNQGYRSNVEKTIGDMDQYASNKVRYAGKVFSKALEAQNEGEKISIEADNLDPKSTDKMILKTQALQLELAAQTNANLAQLLEINTRLYKLELDAKQDRLRDWDVFDKSIQVFKNGGSKSGGN